MPNVKVLLSEKVEKLGEVGEIVSVKPGYARNYLLPQKLATLPTSGEVRRIQKKKELLEKQYQEEKLQAEEVSGKLSSVGSITIFAKAGDAGKLFGRITAKEVSERISTETGTKIQRKQVLLKKPIAELGEFEVSIKLHSEVSTKVRVIIKSED